MRVIFHKTDRWCEVLFIEKVLAVGFRKDNNTQSCHLQREDTSLAHIYNTIIEILLFLTHKYASDKKGENKGPFGPRPNHPFIVIHN